MTPTTIELGTRVVELLRLLEGRPVVPSSRGDAAADGGSARPARYGERTGAGGAVHAVHLNRPDWLASQLDLARALGAVLTSDDVVVLAAPYELSFLGAALERAVELLGAAVISVGTSSTICPAPRLLDLVHRYRVTALVSSPQLAAELAALERAAGRRPAASSLDVLVAVQPAAPERLDRIGATWGASVTSLFGTATMPATAVPCGAGRLHLLDQRLEASVDAPTPGRIAAGSLRGELLLAGCHPSVSRTTPAPTGELVELSPPGEPCPCGSTAPVLLPLGRTGDALPTSCGPLTRLDVEHCLYEHPSVSGRLTVHARQGRLCVECEVVEDSPDLESQLRGHLEERLGVDVDLSLLADGSTGVHARTERGDALNSTYDRSVRRTG